MAQTLIPITQRFKTENPKSQDGPWGGHNSRENRQHIRGSPGSKVGNSPIVLAWGYSTAFQIALMPPLSALQLAARLLGSKGGKAGRGKAKSRCSDQMRAAVLKRWKKAGKTQRWKKAGKTQR